jgi:hypothetical protein
MTQEDKATKFDRLTQEGDVVQRKISKLKSANAFIKTTTEAYDKELHALNTRLQWLKDEMESMFR